jgi:hypothetical protein
MRNQVVSAAAPLRDSGVLQEILAKTWLMAVGGRTVDLNLEELEAQLVQNGSLTPAAQPS